MIQYNTTSIDQSLVLGKTCGKVMNERKYEIIKRRFDSDVLPDT